MTEYNTYKLFNLVHALSKHIQCAGGTLYGIDGDAERGLEDRASHAYNHLLYLNQGLDELFISLNAELDFELLGTTEAERIEMLRPAYNDEVFRNTLRKLGYELNGTIEERAKALNDTDKDFLEGTGND